MLDECFKESDELICIFVVRFYFFNNRIWTILRSHSQDRRWHHQRLHQQRLRRQTLMIYLIYLVFHPTYQMCQVEAKITKMMTSISMTYLDDLKSSRRRNKKLIKNVIIPCRSFTVQCERKKINVWSTNIWTKSSYCLLACEKCGKAFLVWKTEKIIEIILLYFFL